MANYPNDWHLIAKRVKEEAGNRCVRCGHPADNAWKTGPQRLTLCDDNCVEEYHVDAEAHLRHSGYTLSNASEVESLWMGVPQRILTVHHLDGDPQNCEWWNLAALCQVCHLSIQGKVRMEQVWPFEHSEWFKPYVAGYLAYHALGRNLPRETITENIDEFLALENMG